jgi:hypothetical protein
LPLTFLDHRLMHGDSIAGPFFASLTTLPVGKRELDPLLARDVGTRLEAALHAALQEVRALEGTVGADAADLALKSAAKRRLDRTLQPFRQLAQAWSGAVMQAARGMDDEWLALARRVAEDGTWPQQLTDRQAAMLAAGQQPLSWDLTFPEVFWPDGPGAGRAGFDAVLSNPPWDIMQPNRAEFLAGADLAILDATSRREADSVRDRLSAEPRVARAWQDHQAVFQFRQRLVERMYEHQRHGAHGVVLGGKPDLYRVFAERMLRLLDRDSAVGMVVPSAFHANEGAAGVRRLYLQQARVELCLSFENRKRLFDIHGRFKFALVVAQTPGPTRSVRCGFYLTDFAQLDERGLMDYDAEFIALSGGMHGTLIELRDCDDMALTRHMFAQPKLGDWMKAAGITLSREIHMTDDAGHFVPAGDSGESKETQYLTLHEGKTIHQFRDRWDTAPRYAIPIADLAGKPRAVECARFYRAACREVARSTDERTAIATMLPPGLLCGHTISVERTPDLRTNAAALSLVAIMNSFPFDWMLRQKAAAHVSIYILLDLPVPHLRPEAARFLSHAALRLCCNHAGFAALWREQLGDAWHEKAAHNAWPAIGADADRWRLRAATDAVIAHAYGLSRAQYERVLAGFSHSSFASMPALCLAAFDEFGDIGVARFCPGYDPYCDIPLVTTRARPVLRLKLADPAHEAYHTSERPRGKRPSWKRRASTSS